MSVADIGEGRRRVPTAPGDNRRLDLTGTAVVPFRHAPHGEPSDRHELLVEVRGGGLS
jgi:hypothetical protein